jgi:hypothetical protein
MNSAPRHTFVSLTKSDVPAEMIKRLVGHSKDMDTFGVYGHEVDGEMDKAAVLLDQVFKEILN